MPIDTADELIQALQESELFTPEGLRELSGELRAIGDDAPALMRHLVQRGQLTVYQLRKVVHRKAAELLLGDYVILDKIGEGGMGKVYRAKHRLTGVDVALKVVRPNLITNPVIRRRHDREVIAAKSLTHPNVVGLLDAGEIDGKYYLAMEFVDGIDLARLIRERGILPCPEACEYIRQAALGLQHAHDMGLVHRDIKPSNIVVSGERHLPGTNEPAIAKILDMGLVRSVGFEESPGGPDLTRDGTVVGTPDYMAPEQAKNSSSVDSRADLYSLGCTFYFLLTGKPPFTVGSPIEKIFKHQLDPPPPLQLARPDVPPELARLVARLMAKKPDERFQTALELAEALEPLARHPVDYVPVAVSASRASGPSAPSDSFSHIAPPSTIGGQSGVRTVSPSPSNLSPPRTPPPEAPPTAPNVGSSDRTPRPVDRPAAKRSAQLKPPAKERPPQRSAVSPPHKRAGLSPLLISAGIAVALLVALMATLVAIVLIRQF